MIQTFLLASLPPPGEGVMGPTGQARAPDGWDSAFADVLVNFLLDQEGEGESQVCLAGAAGVQLPVLPVSVDTAFPVIDAPESQAAVAAAGETGSPPGLTAAAGAAPAFVPPVNPGPPVETGEQVPAQTEAEPAVEVGLPADPAALSTVEATPGSGVDASAVQVPDVGPAATTAGAASSDEQPAQPALAGAPVEPGKAETPAGKTPVAQPRKTGAVTETDAVTGEPAVEKEAAQPSAPAAEGPRPETVGKPAESAAPRVDATAEQALPVDQAMPASTQPQPGPHEPALAGRHTVQTVEGKDQSALMQMVRTIQTSVQQGQSSLRLQLYPEELGSIDVRLVSNAQGVGVTVFADQASTGRLLEMQISQLRASLQDAGVQISHLNVFQQGQQRQEAPADWNRRSYNRRQPPFAGSGQPAADAVEGARLGQSMVDYRV